MRCSISLDTEWKKLRLEVIYQPNPATHDQWKVIRQDILLATISAFPSAEMLQYTCEQLAHTSEGVLDSTALLRSFLNLLLASGALALGSEQLASLA